VKKAHYRLNLLLIFLFSGFCSVALAQTEFRKHFIITIDKHTLQVAGTQHISHLLSNLFSSQYPLHRDYVSLEEKRTKNSQTDDLLFFNPEHDEISVYCPLLSANELRGLIAGIAPNVNSTSFSRFVTQVYKPLNPNWSELNESVKSANQIINYFNRTSRAVYNLSGTNISLPQNLRLPAAISVVADQDKASEQYVLISVNSGRSSPIMQQLESVLNSFSSVGREISNHFKLTPVLNQPITFNNGTTIGNINATAILPINPANNTGFVPMAFKNPPVLRNDKIGSDEFTLCENYLVFKEPENLFPIALKLTISDGARELFSGIIASRENIFENWNSTYTEDNFLLNYNWAENQYFLPDIGPFVLSGLDSEAEKPLKLEIELVSLYEPAQNLDFGIVLRSTQNAFVDFGSLCDLITKVILISVILLFMLALYFIYRGRPLEIRYKIHEHIDSFEKITNGKRKTPYKYWDNDEDNIIINCECVYRKGSFIFNWNPVVYAEIENLKGVPEQFDVTLRHGSTALEEFHCGTTLLIKTDKTHKFDLILNLRNTNSVANRIDSPTLISIPLKLYIREKRLFISSAAKDEFFSYSFHVGPDLKDFWVGFDAGTSSTCVAIGTSDQIKMGRLKNGDYIIPSRVSIDLNEEPTPDQINNLGFPDSIVRYGTAAEFRFNIESDEKFQSIKKLLGYKDVKRITFKNNSHVDLTGSRLTSLLVGGIFRDMKETIEKDKSEYKSVLEDGRFDPKRLVVAIPNNFSQKKINDLVEAFAYLKKIEHGSQQQAPQFLEIRYVYEAEAIVMYYLKGSRNLSRLLVPINEEGKAAPPKSTPGVENILVFDMGGATINATLVTVKQQEYDFETSYDVNIIGKLGYGIGGDTIDYCLIKFIFSFVNDYPGLKTLNPFDRYIESTDSAEGRKYRDLKLQFQQIAFGIKKIIIQNFNKNANILINPAELNDLFGGRVRFSAEDEINYYFRRTEEGSYPLFNHEIFQSLIYRNIIDATVEIVNLGGSRGIDTLIFSGRSTFFPLIRHYVVSCLQQVLKHDITIVDLPIEESKTAVAQGACLYGLNKGGITLNNLKTTGTFGVAKFNSLDHNDVDFIEFIGIGSPFKQNSEEFRYLESAKILESDFRFSNGEVKFLQVMGKDADNILKSHQNHKIVQIGKIRIDMKSKFIYMYVNETDEVKCRVKTIADRVYELTEFVSDQGIADANDEHYTWIVQ